MISMDSPELPLGALSALEGDTRGASLEACALLKDGAPLDDEVANEALLIEEVGGLPP